MKNSIKIYFRNIFSHPVYSLINIIGLTVGLVCFIIIMLWVRYELSYDKFHENANRLCRVAFTNEKGEYHGYRQTGLLAVYLKDNFPEILHSTNFSGSQWKVAYERKGFYCTGSYVDSTFFEMFTFPFILGNPTTALTQPNSIVITKSLSLKLFGDENSLGKPIKVNDGLICTITGIIKDVPKNSHLQFDFLIPFSNVQDWMKKWDSKWTNTYILLQNKDAFDEVNKKIYGVMNKFQPSWQNVLYLVPITESHLFDLGGGGLISYILIFSAMALIIILLACINFMNLSTARSELRQKEIFIKKISGSTRSQLIRQFLSESIFLSFVALIIAIFLVQILLPVINSLINSNLNLKFNFQVIASLFLITLITGLVAGSYPALYLSALLPSRIIMGIFQKSGYKKWKLRQVLVVSQFTISVFFIICVLLISKQLNYIKLKNLGFNKENIISIKTLGNLNEKTTELKTELLQNPNIENVTVASNDFTAWGNSGPIDWPGRNTNELIEIGYNWVDYDFLKTFNLEMNEGRFFSKEFAQDKSTAFILNEKAVSYLHLSNPIGMKVKSWFGVEGTIIGIIKDFHSTSLHDELGPFALLFSERSNNMFIKVNAHEITPAIEYIEKKVKQIVPDDPFDYQFLDNQLANLYRTEALTDKLAIIITVLAIFISCLGLFGLVLSAVEQRQKEIGIRKVNGAKVWEVMVMLNKDFVKWVFIAFLLASPIAWFAMNKWIQNFAYQTTLSWWVFVTAGVVTVIIALLTVSWQSWRAASRNPVEALRYE